jgi:hypothetical protein
MPAPMRPPLSRTRSTPCTRRWWIIPIQHGLLTAIILGHRKMLRLQRCSGSSGSPGSSMWRRPISWCINGLPASTPYF